MEVEDFLFGCRSGIQKAVRRGDIPLARLCFDSLWGNRVHRTWLRWRLPIIAQEETPWYLGELAEFFDGDAGGERQWKKALFEMTLGWKTRDAYPLTFLVTAKYSNPHPEFQFLAPWFTNAVDPMALFGAFSAALDEQREFSEYEQRALSLLKGRLEAGGKLADRRAALAAMALVKFRGLSKEAVGASLSGRVGAYQATDQELRVLPWFVMDVHTRVGQRALTAAMKQFGAEDGFQSEADLRTVWLLFGSFAVPKGMAQYTKVKDDPTLFETMWEPEAVRVGIPSVGGRTPAEMKRWWDDELCLKLQSVVEQKLSEMP